MAVMKLGAKQHDLLQEYMLHMHPESIIGGSRIGCSRMKCCRLMGVWHNSTETSDMAIMDAICAPDWIPTGANMGTF
jgi:hypothetical protein